MSYFIELITTYCLLSLLIEVSFTAFIVWGFCHEEKFICFEDKIIRFLICKWHRDKVKIKKELLCITRAVFIVIYRPYRRMKKRILKRLLRQFGLCAVRCEQVRGYEVLSR